MKDYLRKNRVSQAADLREIRDTDQELHGRAVTIIQAMAQTGLAAESAQRPQPAQPTQPSQPAQPISPKTSTNITPDDDDPTETPTRPRKRKRADSSMNTRTVMVSSPNQSLLKRYSPIRDDTDGSEEIKKKEKVVGGHLVPIGTVRKDPYPRRLIFASFNLDGEMDIKALPIDKGFRTFDTDEGHEKVMVTDNSYVKDWETIKELVHLDKHKIPGNDFDSVKAYVFNKMSGNPEGRYRLRAWTDVSDLDSRYRCGATIQVNKIESRLREPDADPLRWRAQNASLVTMVHQTLAMQELLLAPYPDMRELDIQLSETLWTLTDLNDKYQARELRDRCRSLVVRMHELQLERMRDFILCRGMGYRDLTGKLDESMVMSRELRDQLCGNNRVEWSFEDLDSANGELAANAWGRRRRQRKNGAAMGELFARSRRA